MAAVSLGIEKDLWKMADKLRGNIESAEYKHVVLGLIFLKYISDSFEERYQQLVDEGEGFEEDRDFYTSENVFFVPKEARWNELKKHAKSPEIGKKIDDAMRAIEKENPSLKNVLPKNYARPELDKAKLRELIDGFSLALFKKSTDFKNTLCKC